MPGVYYNDNDPFACEWLRALIAAGELPPGDVDARSIVEVEAADVRPYRQAHYFAGIGGWPLALRWAGWPDDRPVWTGSCPCQPVSSAGQRRGHADERHLWPALHALVAQCAPAVVIGEQVASKDGREWLAAVRADLEELGYACGAADLPAASVGAPHIRQRLFWMAHAEHAGGRAVDRDRQDGRDGPDGGRQEAHGDSGPLGDAGGARLAQRGSERRDAGSADGGDAGEAAELASRRLGDAARDGRGQERADSGPDARGAGPWGDAVWLPCADGRARPAPHPESGVLPLAYGVPGRVGRLRAYGNAIVPQVAAVFVGAVLDVMAEAADA